MPASRGGSNGGPGSHGSPSQTSAPPPQWNFWWVHLDILCENFVIISCFISKTAYLCIIWLTKIFQWPATLAYPCPHKKWRYAKSAPVSWSGTIYTSTRWHGSTWGRRRGTAAAAAVAASQGQQASELAKLDNNITRPSTTTTTEDPRRRRCRRLRCPAYPHPASQPDWQRAFSGLHSGPHSTRLTRKHTANRRLYYAPYPPNPIVGWGIIVGPIPWGHSGPLCHALSLSSLW